MANPLFRVPPGTETVRVRIIDTTTRLGKLPLDFLMQPPMEGMNYMPEMPAWSFLIEHSSGQKLLFDLAVPKDWRSFSPFILQILDKVKSEITVKYDVIDILKNNNIAADQISGIIWRYVLTTPEQFIMPKLMNTLCSHWHFDHVGNPSQFPPSTDLIVGPGFKNAFYPGYPAIPDSPVREIDFA